jgi:hypothetical protein
MSLRLNDGAAGAPWDRPLHGTLEKLVVESDLLAGNPLGDPRTARSGSTCRRASSATTRSRSRPST